MHVYPFKCYHIHKNVVWKKLQGIKRFLIMKSWVPRISCLVKRASFSSHLNAKVSYLLHLGTFWPQIFAVTSSLLKMPVFTVATFLPQLPNEPVMRRITTDKATKRTRQILSETEWVSLDLHWICNTSYILFWSQPLKFKICCVLKTFCSDLWNI